MRDEVGEGNASVTRVREAVLRNSQFTQRTMQDLDQGLTVRCCIIKNALIPIWVDGGIDGRM